ncbi:MAG: M23 family metallopeptidase [Chloroflexi bacterium]|nr:M23 family metallopeptidase [Chloroflexota bacterium]
MRCVERVDVPAVPNVIEAKWSPDNKTLAVVWFARVPDKTTIVGYRETEIIDTLDTKTGRVRPLGVGDHPQWSASGAYVSYWGPNADQLRVVHDDRIVAELLPTMPEARWVGDALLYVRNKEIRIWDDGVEKQVALLGATAVPRYPRDDMYFSADGVRFTVTRYRSDGTADRYVGLTKTGDVDPLDADDASYMEWAPKGSVLLLRFPGRLEVRDLDVGTVTSIPAPASTVTAWSPGGAELLIGRVSPTVPAANSFDPFASAWPKPGSVASLPNVLGARAFTNDGKLFVGVARTAREETTLVVHRCGNIPAAAALGDADAPARLQKITAEGGRFVRPAAGDIAQYLQGSHTGLDIAAPFGSLVVAADDGVVTEAGWIPNGGNRVCIRHATPGLESCYHHDSALLVSVGERVVRGQPIALIGMTGLTTGPHVHWEVKLFGRIVDPLRY